MLRTLHIRNYVLIDSLDIDFPAGLVIITGQTGAGKSILLGALGLLLGDKADSSVLSTGADHCVVEAEFETSDERIRSILEDNEIEDDGLLTIRRVVSSAGRSRSFINDCPVPVSVLSDVSSRLVDIHSQHQSLLLADKTYQLSLLDSYCGNAVLLSECSDIWKKLQSLKDEYSGVCQKLKRLSDEQSYTEALYTELESAKLQDGELEELEAEQRLLADAESIKEDLSGLLELLSPSSDEAGPGVTSSLKELVRSLDKLQKYIPSAGSLSSRMESVRLEVEDVQAELDTINSRLEVSPDRLQIVEDRMSFLYAMMRKHSCRDVASLIAKRDELSALLYDSSALEERKCDLEKEISEAQEALLKVSDSLSASRRSKSGEFSSLITSDLKYLELDRAVFEVSVEKAAQGPSGYDSVCFRFAADGRSPIDVSRCASGGEMSRIMLCLKALMARYSSMPTMIFDEIDTGVSGSVADKMGSMICRMGSYMQIFAITHLPQVAAKGAAHYLVSKSMDEKTTSSVRRLSEDERVMEVARMLSGSSVTEAAIQNAISLIKESE